MVVLDRVLAVFRWACLEVAKNYMALMDWMSAGQGPGPGPLDLTTPLAEGMRQGTAMAEQQEKARSDYANEQAMSARLGLEQKHESFEESVWNSQANMRSAQLDLTKDQALESANNLGNVAADNTTMVQAKSALADAFAKGDAQSLANLPAFTFRTPQAQQSWEQTLNQAHQSALGKTAAANLNMDLTAKTSMAEDQLAQKKAVMNIPGADYNSFFDKNSDGTNGQWNSAKAATAITDFNHSEDVFKSKNAASVYSAYARGTSSVDVANIRATSYQTAAGLKAATGDYKIDMDSITQALKSGAINEQQADQQIDAARYRRQNPNQTTSPSSPSASSATGQPLPPWSGVIQGLVSPTGVK